MKRINKRTAHKLFEEKKSFFITACNMRPEYGILINSVGRYYEGETFDTVVNAFIYYNCNSETGRYPAFYIEE